MKWWWMMPFEVWKYMDMCSSLLPGLSGRGRVAVLERGLSSSSTHEQSAWQLQCGDCLHALSDEAAGKGDELRSVTLDAACCFFSCHVPWAWCCLKLSSEVCSCSCSCAGIRRGRPDQCLKPFLSQTLFLWFHQHRPLVMAPFSASWDAGWMCLLHCSQLWSSRTLLPRLLSFFYFFFLSW